MVGRGELHLHLFSRGCMRVIEDMLIEEVAPLLQAYVIGGLVIAFVKVCSCFLACCAADHIRRMVNNNEYYDPVDATDEGKDGNPTTDISQHQL